MKVNFPFIKADIKRIGDRTYWIRKLELEKIRIIFDYIKEEGVIFVKYIDFRGRIFNSAYMNDINK